MKKTDDGSLITDKNSEIQKPFEERTPAEFTEYRPTWVFEWNTQNGALTLQSIKVDALSGEITIDASDAEMNRLRAP